ncbi:MAG: hypothetical protein CMB80_02370 [Flammeovirgaceae bacterium]|nr:hypothetical protein [Flammeovirgaceae bacterium]
MVCNFSYKHYEECLVLAKSRGYDFFRFCDYEMSKKSSKFVFLRHDVDHSLDLAMKMAEIENRIGVRATYFVRLHSKKYNILSLESTQKLNLLKEMGHEIGFHYEPSYASAANKEVDKSFSIDLATLENCIDEKIVSVSPHEPTREGTFVIDERLMNKNGLTYQAYSDIFVRDLKYISDSSCHWREGCMHGFIVNDVPKLCILTHPFWWYHKTSLENY